MTAHLDVSVIIPTYNRKKSVLKTLESLNQQTLTPDRYEVIVVDDGSPDDTWTIAKNEYAFAFHYIRQENQGATKARNHGVEQSQGKILVFIDDDVTVSEQTLEALATSCLENKKVLVMGTLIARSRGEPTLYTKMMLASENHVHHADDSFVDFSFCNTELLAVKRIDFYEIGMLNDPTDGRGWPNWDDVDFGYRAHLKGFRLLQSSQAIGEHWDYSIGDWSTACQRWKRASKSAVLLFQKHPNMQPRIPMLTDKAPVAWGSDTLPMVLRKLVRSAASSVPMLKIMALSTKIVEQYFPSPTLLRPLYRWLGGGYMYQGFKEGVREYGKPETQAR